METWMTWIEALIQRFDRSVRALGLASGIAENKISRWRYGHNLPTPADQMKLATVSGESLESIAKMVWDASLERDTRRRRPGMRLSKPAVMVRRARAAHAVAS